MKLQIKVLFIITVAIFTAGFCLAGDTLQQFGDIKGRSYHSDLYEEPSCDSCHDKAEPVTIPEDFVCLDCHDGDDLIQATERPEDEKWQNPHNNMHFGKDVPCMECHGEHQEVKMLCVGCHSFSYPNYKK